MFELLNIFVDGMALSSPIYILCWYFHLFPIQFTSFAVKLSFNRLSPSDIHYKSQFMVLSSLFVVVVCAAIQELLNNEENQLEMNKK